MCPTSSFCNVASHLPCLPNYLNQASAATCHAAQFCFSPLLSCRYACIPGDLSFVLPPRHLTSIVEALKAFDHLVPGLYSKNTLLYGVEVKFYSSKLLVDKRFMTPITGLYAIGDGAGITRGLMQASVTGVAVARDIAEQMN